MKKLILLLFLIASISSFAQRANTSTGGGGGSMLWPSGTGIPVVNNGAWGTTISNNIPISYFNSGTSASATTFWRGDGVWAVPSGTFSYPAGSGFVITTGSAWGTTIPAANVAYFGSAITGTPSASTYLRGDGSWGTPTGGSGTVTSVTAGNGMTQTGTATIDPTLNIVSHAGTAGSIGTINIGADAIGVNLGTTSTTAFRGDYGNTAYNDKINSVSVSGTTTKTITLNQQDGTTLTASFTDETGSGGTGSNVYVNDVFYSNPNFKGTTFGDLTFANSGSDIYADIKSGVVGATELASTSVSPNSYTMASFTVDEDGRLTTASSYTYPSSGVVTSSGSAFSSVSGTSNQLLRRNATNTAYEFFTPNYLTSFAEDDPFFKAHTVYNISNGTGFLKNNGSGTWSYDNNTYLTQSSFNSANADLAAIEAISGTTGLLRKTAANTWSLDNAPYLTANQTITLSGHVTGSGTTSISTTLANSSVSYAKLSAYGTPSNGDVLTYNTTYGLAWTTHNYVPTTRTLTINGTTYDLSANRTWTIAAGVSGSGNSGQVTYWSSSSAVTSSSNFTFNAGTGIVTANNFQLSSDRKLKTKIKPLQDLEWVDEIAFVSFRMKSDKKTERYGVVAQQVEKANKNLVSENADGYKSVSYTDLLIAKVARQDQQIKDLEERIARLEKLLLTK